MVGTVPFTKKKDELMRNKGSLSAAEEGSGEREGPGEERRKKINKELPILVCTRK